MNESSVVTASVELFASVRETSATPLLGTEDDTLLAAGGTLMAYGEGGAGKTTAELDVAFHMAAGIPWLDQPVPARVRGLILEAEGPRGKLRTKLAAKLAAWTGPDIDGWLHVIESPWATLSLADPEHERRSPQRSPPPTPRSSTPAPSPHSASKAEARPPRFASSSRTSSTVRSRSAATSLSS